MPAPLNCREEFEAWAIQEIEKTGLDRMDKAAIVAPFRDKAGKTTLYGWLDILIKSGRAGQAITEQMRRDAAARAEVTKDAAASAAKESALLVERMPAPRMEDVTGFGVVAFTAKLQDIIRTYEWLLTYARGDEEGKPRNSKLLLSANEGLRRSLETALKLQEQLQELSAVDRMMSAVIEEIGKESPELAERVVKRLRLLSAAWGA